MLKLDHFFQHVSNRVIMVTVVIAMPQFPDDVITSHLYHKYCFEWYYWRYIYTMVFYTLKQLHVVFILFIFRALINWTQYQYQQVHRCRIITRYPPKCFGFLCGHLEGGIIRKLVQLQKYQEHPIIENNHVNCA